MLQFLRKHQKGIYIVVTFVIVITFSFFGVQRGQDGPSSSERDHVIGTAVDGSTMKYQKMQKMARFLASDCEDVTDSHFKEQPNIFNDGVIRNDLLRTGIASMVVQAYIKDLQVEFETKCDNFKRFKPYANPQVPFLSAENVWNQFAPKFAKDFKDFKENSDDNPVKVFNSLVRLYLDQSDFPAQFLRQILYYQQSQMGFAQPDPMVQSGDLTLFYAHSPADWFGHRFVQLMTQFVHNGARYAKSIGFTVSDDEARASLLANGMQTLKRMGREVSEDEVKGHFARTLAGMRIKEKEAVAIWKEVLLMRRLCENAKGKIAVDPLIYRNFNDYAQEEISFDLFQLPSELVLKDFEDLMQFQMYVEAIAEKPAMREADLLQLPRNNFKEPAHLAKRFPNLVQKRYLLDVKEVSTDQLAQSVGVKEMWEFQRSDAFWGKLCKNFPALKPKESDRMGAIERLLPEVRAQLDAFTREQIVLEHPEWASEALDNAELTRKEVAITSGGLVFGLEGFDNTGILEKALSKSMPEMLNTSGKQIYRIEVIDRDDELSILTYKEAKERSIAKALVDERLSIYYPTIRGAHAAKFQNGQGSWKLLADVREDVGRLLFAPLLTEMGKIECKKGNCENMRFYPHLVTLMKHQSKENTISSFVKREEPVKADDVLSARADLADQWKLQYSQEKALRKSPNQLVDSAIFRMKSKEWTDVITIGKESLGFLQITSKDVDATKLVEKVKRGREILGMDIARSVASDLIREVVSKEAIHLNTIEDKLAGDDDTQ
ncbi:MAG: SurA N-terminal domain-containing protein [Simkaniaceae bacterium]|nr:SurA N-terminal domain-containing protein [Simkaniaceae bacterium]